MARGELRRLQSERRALSPSPWSLSRVAARATSKLALSNFLSGRRRSVENGERDTSLLGENSSNGPAERLHRSPETRTGPRNASCREGNYRCRARGSCESRRALLRRAAELQPKVPPPVRRARLDVPWSFCKNNSCFLRRYRRAARRCFHWIRPAARVGDDSRTDRRSLSWT